MATDMAAHMATETATAVAIPTDTKVVPLMDTANDSAALLKSIEMGALRLENRVVMAPMTRNRADDDGVPTAIMTDYYRDRAGAGLVIVEGTWPSVTGQAYNRQPGIETEAQIAAWRTITDAVHEQGGQIVLQIMHGGRIGSQHIKPQGVVSVSPSALQARGKVYTDAAGMQPFDVPKALSTDEVGAVVEEHRQAACNARQAGFDGVELHCTSGYLPMQFLCSGTNKRTDRYGGDAAGRARFAFECLQAMADELGGDRVGLRINPGNSFNDTQDDDPAGSHIELLQQAAPLGLAYLHIMRAPGPEIDAFALAREHFSGPLIINDNFDPDSAAAAIRAGQGEAVSFGRHFIANPDLVDRIRGGITLSGFDRDTLYTPGATGYSDYAPA